jgi:hypothetical protein
MIIVLLLGDDDCLAYIDCCGDVNFHLFAVDIDEAVGEHVQICVETPLMIEPHCHHAVIDKHKLAMGFFEHGENFANQFQNKS